MLVILAMLAIACYLRRPRCDRRRAAETPSKALDLRTSDSRSRPAVFTTGARAHEGLAGRRSRLRAHRSETERGRHSAAQRRQVAQLCRKPDPEPRELRTARKLRSGPRREASEALVHRVREQFTNTDDEWLASVDTLKRMQSVRIECATTKASRRSSFAPVTVPGPSILWRVNGPIHALDAATLRMGLSHIALTASMMVWSIIWHESAPNSLIPGCMMMYEYIARS
jgi:hypothetical protein